MFNCFPKSLCIKPAFQLAFKPAFQPFHLTLSTFICPLLRCIPLLKDEGNFFYQAHGLSFILQLLYKCGRRQPRTLGYISIHHFNQPSLINKDKRQSNRLLITATTRSRSSSDKLLPDGRQRPSLKRRSDTPLT